jgi:predicted dinucleotide-binding enzyme
VDVPLAGDDAEPVQLAAQLLRDVGCEPVVVGSLAAASSFERGGPAFGRTRPRRNCVACSICPK